MIEVEGATRLDIREPVAEVRTRLRDLERITDQVEVNADIRGGEPVFRGTRVPVHMVAGFLERGVSGAEVLEDYPALTEESLEIGR